MALRDREITKPTQPRAAGPIPFAQHFNRVTASRAFEAIDARIAHGIDSRKVENTDAPVATVTNERPEDRVGRMQITPPLSGRERPIGGRTSRKNRTDAQTSVPEVH